MFKRIISDIIIWIISAVICILWRVVADKSEIQAYIIVFSIMAAAWVILGLILQKYTRSYKDNWYWQDMLAMIVTGGALMGLCWWLIPTYYNHVSMNVILWMIGIVMVIDAVDILMKHYWKFALNMNIPANQTSPKC